VPQNISFGEQGGVVGHNAGAKAQPMAGVLALLAVVVSAIAAL
jgi:hypothetical protein